MLEYIVRDDGPKAPGGENNNQKPSPVKVTPVDVRPVTADAMAQYQLRLETKLIETGYRDAQVRRLVKTASGLGRYLAWKNIDLPDAGTAELEAYSKYCG